ncbi:MAG: alpha-E domain-containing protein [Sandaracinaceae bacterium]|nr:alpha-E domain-containing protein [Sandaracinaceae bacterium]
MLSRVADAVYWMNRYVERAENVARFVDVNLHLALDLPEGAFEQWAPIVATTGDDAWFKRKYGEATRANVMEFLTFDAEYSSSILSCLRAARENARSVREIISSEMWEAINTASLFVTSAASRGSDVLAHAHDFYAEVKRASQLYLGVSYVTMTHNEAWHFARLARLMERADKTSRIVDVKYFILLPDPDDVGTPYDEIQWAALLKSASAFEMYRKKHGRIAPLQVIEFLLLDPKFPRSLRYCVTKGERSLHAITGTPLDSASTLAEKRLGKLRSELEYGDAKEIVHSGLHEHLDAFQRKLNAVGEAIQSSFFGG